MPSIPELREPLSDGEVALRPSAERDIPEILIAYQDDPQMHQRLGDDAPPSAAELGRRSERAEADRLAGTGLTLTIVLPGSDDCVGEVRIHHLDWASARAELGVWLAPSVRGRGLAPRALRLTGQWLIEAADMERVQLLTEPDNQAMMAAARSAGFEYEGILRGYTRERGKRVDVAVFSLLPADLRR